MGIDESSPFYAAMQEIEKRYLALYFTIEMLNSLNEKSYEQGFEKYCFDFFQLIAREIIPYEVIINENGKKEFIAQRVKISRRDTYAVNAYQNAQQAYHSFQEMNYEAEDKKKVCEQISRNILCMIHWIMMVREMRLPVNHGKFDAICNM